MTVSILLATTGRPDMAERAASTALEEAGDNDVEIVAAVDADRNTYDALDPLGARITYADEYRGAARAWNDALRLAEGPLYVLAADDLVFLPGWLDAALDALTQHPGHLIGFNDGHWGAELSTHYLLPRDFIVEVLGGVIAWECYPHSFHDREANERARLAGRYHWCESARVDHEHWLFGNRTRDATDELNLGRHHEAEAAFARRAAQGFPNDYDPAIGGRDGQGQGVEG